MAHPIFARQDRRLHVEDVRAMLRLCNALHLHAADEDSHDRKHKLLDGVRTLIDADRASASVAAFNLVPARDRPGAGKQLRAKAKPEPFAVVSIARRGREPGDVEDSPEQCPWHAYRTRHQRRMRTKATAPDWCTLTSTSAGGAAANATSRNRQGKGRSKGKMSGAGHFLHSFLPLIDGRVVACLSVSRDPGRARFSKRDLSVVCTLHAEVSWVYRPDVILVSPETRDLPRRERETLHHLLAGKGEKQIAAALGLRYNTVHHYVKAVYRHFRVNSRSELLARWLGT